MDARIQARLNEIRTRGYSFNLGDYLSKGFNVFGKQAGLYIGFTVLFIIIAFVAGMIGNLIPVVGSLANQLYLIPCLTAGYYILSYKIIANKQPQAFGDMFTGFQKPVQLILWALINLIFSIVVVLLMLLVTGTFSAVIEFFKTAMGGGQPDPEDVLAMFRSMWGAFALIYLVFIVAYTFLSFTVHFIVICKMQVMDAIKASFLLASKNYFMIILMFIVLGIFMLIGALPCGLGLLVAIPVMYTTTTSAFCDIMQLDREEEEPMQSFSNDGLLDS